MGPLSVLLLLLCAEIWGITGEEALTPVIGEMGEQIILPCSAVAESTTKVAWFVDESTKEVLSCDSNRSSDGRLMRTNGSSLLITGLLLTDEGSYGCRDCLQSAAATPHIQLNVTSGPHNVSLMIYTTTALPNGTLYTSVGSNITFACASASFPPPMLDIVLYSQDKNESFKRGNAAFISLPLEYIGRDYSGNYTCSAENPISGRKVSTTRELLIYYPPLLPMQCSASNTGKPSELNISCSWPNGFPAPILEWETNGETMLNVTSEALLNGSQYNTGQTLVCKGKHVIDKAIKEQRCEVTLGRPVPQSQPLRTCLIGENVTLSCSVSGANPPATITWLRNLSDPEIVIQPGNKYQIVQDSSISFLTIVNCSKETDVGYYSCKVENALDIKDINIWLEVTKPHNIVGLVSALLILFLLVAGLITGIIMYCDPWVYWKANPFRSGQSEVLVLVDSEDEEEEDTQAVGNSVEMYTDTVETSSSVPTAANGNIYKHEVLFHHPPDNLSPGLINEVQEDTESENQGKDI